MRHPDPRSEPSAADQPPRWCAILPVRGFAEAKSRLGAELPNPPGLRSELARAFALDVLTSVSGCPGIARVLVVGDGGPELLRHFDTTASAAVVSAISAPTGLNVAVEHGESWARRRQHRRIAVIAADLPCLTAADLLPVLAAAATTTRGFVTDEGRAGTTILTTTGPGLRPEFGEHSARRHLATGAEPLPATAGARLDVDHLTALLHARDLGVGMATAAVLSRYRIEPSRSHDRGRLDRG